MKKYIAFTAAALLVILTIGAVSVKWKTPDFAFPDKVATEAIQQLDSAMTAGDDQTSVRALMDYSLARVAISTDYLPETIAKIDSVAAMSDSCTASLLYLLESDIYYDIYSNNRWRFDEREAPLDPLPANPQEWTGKQFQRKITDLLSLATRPANALQKSPLRDWTRVIYGNQTDYIFYPTLLDFVYNRAINRYQQLDSRAITSNPYRTVSFDDISIENPSELNQMSEYNRKAWELNHQLIELNADRPAPRILAEIEAIDILTRDTYNNDNNNTGLLFQLYEANAESEYGAEALLAINWRNINQKKVLAKYIQQAIDRFPNYIRVNNLKEKLNNLMTATASLHFSSCFVPGEPKTAQMLIQNVNSARLIFFKDSLYNSPIVDKTITIDSILPYEGTIRTTITLPESGKYNYLFLLNDETVNNTEEAMRRSRQVTCTLHTPFLVNFNEELFPYVVNPLTGQPLKGVSVKAKSSNAKSTDKIDFGETNADGTITLLPENLGQKAYTYTFTLNGHSMSEKWYGTHKYSSSKSFEGTILTDLPLYHPGDTINWTCVIYNSDYMGGIVANKEVTIHVFDTNNQSFYEEKMTTDRSGRIVGNTALPSEGLYGSYHIEISDSKGKFIATRYFQVNDYKLPTFTAEASVISRSKTDPDAAVTIECKATTFSGVPLSNANVTVSLKENSRYYYYNSEDIWSTDTILGNDGTLTLRLPAKLFENKNAQNLFYNIEFNITSKSGETRSAFAFFSTGKPYTIVPELSGETVCTDKPFTLLPKVVAPSGDEVSIPLQIKITNEDDIIVANAPVEKLNLKDITPGEYKITYTPVDTTLANPYETDDIIFYSESGACPVDDNIWMPYSNNTTLTTDGGPTYELSFGVGDDNAHILVIESVDSIVTSRRWITKNSGMHHYKVNIPDGSHEIKVKMISYKNCFYFDEYVTIKNSQSYPKIKIASETFRNNVIPGNSETISLSVTDKNNNPSPSYVMMAMNSEAINKIVNFQFSLNPPRLDFPDFGTQFNSLYSSYHTSYRQPLHIGTTNFELPEFILYGQSYLPSRYYRRSRAYASSAPAQDIEEALGGMVSGLAIQEKEVLGSTDYDAGVDDLNEIVVTGYGSSTVEEVSMLSSEAKDDAEEHSADNFNYRPSEIPLAFFAPMLETDSAGRLTYTYTVPNANTTWNLYTVAYTDRMLTANSRATIVASRPVMVQSNLPRFLRYGDKIDLKSLVMNNTDSTITTTTTVTLLDASTMEVIGSKEYTNKLNAKESTTVSYLYETTAKGQAIIYRVKSSTGNHSDGEQDIIPLLPATQPVITSTPFFIPASVNDSTIILPQLGNNGNSTLYLYDNPIWEIITALPSLREETPKTSTAAALSLYSAVVSQELMKKYPGIKKGLADWINSDHADSTMTSMLERNDDLKQLTLNATPWVQDAMTDNERLDRLALLLDDSNTDKAIKTAIKTLEDLAQNDGGFAWCPGYNQSSEWVTDNILSLMANLKLRGYMPANKSLNRMIDKAINYCDSLAIDRYDRYNKKSDYIDYDVVMRHSILGKKSTNPIINKITNNTIQSILRNWKRESIMGKATDAVLLHYNGYPTMAKKIVASILAYSISSPDKGIWWQNNYTAEEAALLSVFNIVNPDDSKVIDAMAQWLILAKVNQTWGNGADTATAIDALLGAIPAEQAINAPEATVTLNGRPLDGNVATFPGMTVANISEISGNQPNTLQITKSTGLPAFGSFINRSVMSMDDIPAHSNPSVSIEKRLNVTAGTDVLAADTLKIGDRVNVQLVLTVKDGLDYVTIIDRNGACLEPVDQLSNYRSSDGLWYYREVTDTETRLYIGRLYPGTYLINYDTTVMASGSFSSGVATLQSQLNPSIDANSSSHRIIVNE